MPEFSIIVPVYKVEKYLSRCIKSILSQEFGNFELILVDDGSPDSCGKICDEFAKNDARISVIHKNNGGVSSARNCGLKQACGKYICFVDSDDIIARNTLQLVQESINQFNPDMVIFDYSVIDSNATDIIDSTIGNIEGTVVDKKQAFDLCADFNRTVRMGIWNKIYRKECIPTVIKGFEKFAQNTKDRILYIFIGDQPEEYPIDIPEKIKSVFQELDNVTLLLPGYVFPIPRSIMKNIDLAIASSGSAAVLADEGVTTITMDGEDGQPITVYKMM